MKPEMVRKVYAAVIKTKRLTEGIVLNFPLVGSGFINLFVPNRLKGDPFVTQQSRVDKTVFSWFPCQDQFFLGGDVVAQVADASQFFKGDLGAAVLLEADEFDDQET